MKNKVCIRILTLLGVFTLLAAHPVQAEQSTLGKDFWVTLMRADADNPSKLSLTISSKRACSVTISNPYTGYTHTVALGNNDLQEIEVAKEDCYVGTAQNEVVSNRALHVEATENISLFAGNWRNKSFDVTNVLPTAALRDEYRIQCYTPSDHDNTNQGSHFAIVATEDNTVVDYMPTVGTAAQGTSGGGGGGTGGGGGGGWSAPVKRTSAFDTVQTATLNKGQVWYVWSGTNDGANADLSGSYVKARDGKQIAVFNGNPHTNIPYKIRDRDHIFSQAMPTAYWGTRFTVTASETRRKDKIRIMALYDGTTVHINGDSIYTFDFSTNSKHYYEFELGTANSAIVDKNGVQVNDGSPVIEGTSCYVETSCPCAVHLFMVSNRYDYPIDPYCAGDPAMVWINPIEQVIDEITFATYQSYNHYVNVVTDVLNVGSMTLDGTSISSSFQPLTGNINYMFARLPIASGTHTLKGDAGFIAHVYGYGEKESYGYSAGGATRPVEQYIYINGVVFSPTTTNTLCGIDTITFTANLNYPTDSIRWDFGDGSPLAYGDTVKHLYGADNTYDAVVQVFFKPSDVCGGTSTLPTEPIHITVNTQSLQMTVDSPAPTCAQHGNLVTVDFRAQTGLVPDSCFLRLSDDMKALGFAEDSVAHSGYISFAVPNTIPAGSYNAALFFATDNCGSDSVPFSFDINYPDTVIAQRWNDVLALRNLATCGADLDGASYQWYKNGVEIAGATGTYLYEPLDTTATYAVRIDQNGKVRYTCDMKPVAFAGTDDVTVSPTYIQPNGMVELQSTMGTIQQANVMTSMGTMLASQNIAAKQATVEMPTAQGVYVLMLTMADGKRKSFKVIVK